MTAATEPDVWVVVLTWNGASDTLALLASLEEHVVPSHSRMTVLHVDNMSSDDTVARVAADFPWVRQLQTGANLGYAGGNNRGVEHALLAGAEVVVVLNNDTVAVDDFLAPLIAYLSDAPGAAVSPDVRYFSRPDDSWFRGGTLSQSWPRHLQTGEWPTGDQPFRTEWLCGCCVAASAATWRDVGGFDEWLFLIYEDADWSMRATALGHGLWVVPASRVLHRVSSSLNAAGTTGLFYWSRNGVVVMARHRGLGAAARLAGQQVVRPALRTVVKGPARRRAFVSARGLLQASLRVGTERRARRRATASQ